jgi:diaminopimelate decarboxylase
MSGSGSSPSKKLSYIDPAEFTPNFQWAKSKSTIKAPSQVTCEAVPLVRIAEAVGTPTYVYSAAAIDGALSQLHRGLGKLPHTLCFAVKSNGNLAILRRIADEGNGFDIVSGGELALLERIGVSGERIVFSGVGKTREEIRGALRYRSGRYRSGSSARRGILLFNVESEAELEVLLEESTTLRLIGSDAPGVSIRVNPDVEAGGHPHIATGQREHKFGLGWEHARKLYLAYRRSSSIRWDGISVHIGSQIASMQPFRTALRRVASYVTELRSAGIDLKYLDFGGGLGVRYTNEKPPSRENYARITAQIVRPLGLHLLLEPGRTIVGPAGVLLTRVLYVKESGAKRFVVVDAAMNDLIRPTLYGAIHPITRVTRERPRDGRSAKNRRTDIVGPVCESGDCFLHDWPIEDVRPGDTLAIWAAGAYGMSQTSNYNARCRPAEVLVEGNRYRVIRKRETLRDLMRLQIER